MKAENRERLIELSGEVGFWAVELRIRTQSEPWVSMPNAEAQQRAAEDKCRSALWSLVHLAKTLGIRA